MGINQAALAQVLIYCDARVYHPIAGEFWARMRQSRPNLHQSAQQALHEGPPCAIARTTQTRLIGSVEWPTLNLAASRW